MKLVRSCLLAAAILGCTAVAACGDDKPAASPTPVSTDAPAPAPAPCGADRDQVSGQTKQPNMPADGTGPC